MILRDVCLTNNIKKYIVYISNKNEKEGVFMKLLKNAVAILLIATIISTLVVVPTSIAANNVTVTVNGTKN